MNPTLLKNPEILDPDYTPEEIVCRTEIIEEISCQISTPGIHLHLFGPRGSGKTLLIRRAIEQSVPTTSWFYISCVKHDTQYKVLIELLEQLTGEVISGGYHTAQMQDRVAELTEGRRLVIILDEVDFLLENDASDLLYYLSRLNHDGLNIVTVSTRCDDLSSRIDERTFSTLNPRHQLLEPYSITETYKILEQRTRIALYRDLPLPKDALSTIAISTANIHLALFWLREAADHGEQGFSEELIRKLRSRAVKQYRDYLLEEFTPHHRFLCQVVEDITKDSDHVHTGAIYENYRTACPSDMEPLTDRRISDFLKHLELLGIIEADYHYGGADGKTREIQLNQT